MSSRIYFDPKSHRKSDSFYLDGVVRSDEKRSYDVEDWIGRGGTAAVYRCRESGTGDEYAIKFLMKHTPQLVERFKREVRLFKRLTGNHFVRYRGAGEVGARSGHGQNRRLFVVMELADKNLSEVMRSSDIVVNIPQVCKAFILASTTVERQWVQRRGRVLRTCSAIAKTHSVIHDLLVLPPSMEEGLDPDARGLVRSELRRVQEFARLARNAGQPDGPLAMIASMADAAYL